MIQFGSLSLSLSLSLTHSLSGSPQERPNPPQKDSQLNLFLRLQIHPAQINKLSLRRNTTQENIKQLANEVTLHHQAIEKPVTFEPWPTDPSAVIPQLLHQQLISVDCPTEKEKGKNGGGGGWVRNTHFREHFLIDFFKPWARSQSSVTVDNGQDKKSE